jgi:DNA-binding NarL/FixJ family response regulator
MREVVIIEDDFVIAKILQASINKLQGFTCDRLYSNPLPFLEEGKKADIIILDLNMPEMHGLEAIPRILACCEDMNIIVFTIQDDSETIFKALQLGATGYIDKQSSDIDLENAFQVVAGGGAYMTPAVARKIVNYFQTSRKLIDRLTDREKEIAEGIIDGLSYKLIADRLFISIDTVRMHIKGIYKKLQINSKGELFKIWKG